MKLKTLPRETGRLIRFIPHWLVHRNSYEFHGATIRLPSRYARYAGSDIVKGAYEWEEAQLIGEHLNADIPVVELGGSLGVVSSLIRNKLDPATRHVVVEANAALVPVLSGNLSRQKGGDQSLVLAGAIHYGAPAVSFTDSDNIHGNRISDDKTGNTVKALTLFDCHEALGRPQSFDLVCDIEGAEFALFENDAKTLAAARLAIIEIHPDRFAESGRSENDFFDLAHSCGFEQHSRLGDVLVLKRAA